MPVETAFTKLVGKNRADVWAEEKTGEEIAVHHKFGWTDSEDDVTIHHQVLNPQDYVHKRFCLGTILGARKNADGSHDIDVRIIE